MFIVYLRSEDQVVPDADVKSSTGVNDVYQRKWKVELGERDDVVVDSHDEPPNEEPFEIIPVFEVHLEAVVQTGSHEDEGNREAPYQCCLRR